MCNVFKVKLSAWSCFIILLLLVHLCSCIGAGTHGSIKGYSYPVTKRVLQDAVEKVIATNPNIQRDTIVNYYIDETNGKKDTVFDNYYNDGNNYLIIYISQGEIKNEYTLKYGGSKMYWDTAKTASIFIAYAHDKEGNGGSKGDGGVTFYTPSLKKKFVDLFEGQFIDKLDKELSKKHTKE